MARVGDSDIHDDLLDDLCRVDVLVAQCAGHGRMGHLTEADVEAIAQMRVVAQCALPSLSATATAMAMA